MDTKQIADRLVELCRAGENRKAIEELFADDAAAIEPMDCGPQGRETRGKDALLAANDWFFENNEVHGGSVDGPYPHDDEFICFMSLDVTPKTGPMEGKRMEMKEAAKYVVRDGKIVESRFFYAFEC